MPEDLEVIKKVLVDELEHPIDRTYTLLDGIGTVAGDATSGSYLSTRWYVSGVDGITEPYDGMKIAIKIPLAGVGTAGAILSINGNNDSGYHPVAYNINTVFTTHYGVGSIKVFIYDASATMTCYKTSNTKVTVTGVWKGEADYNSNSTSYLSYTAGAVSSGTTKNYIIGKPTVASNGTNKYNANVYFENNGTLNAPTLSEGGTELEEKYVLQTQTFLNNSDGKDIRCNIYYSSNGIKIGIDAKTTGTEYWEAGRSSIEFYYDGVYINGKKVSTTKYIHNIILKENNVSGSRGTVVSFQLKNDVSTSYTSVDDINTALRSKGYTSSDLTLHANGKYYYNNSFTLLGIYSNSTTQIGVRGSNIASSSNAIANYGINISNITIEQDVVEED